MSQRQVIQLYKNLLKESRKFPSYNFRNYALRRIRDSFKENKQLSDQAAIDKRISEGRESLEVIKRQVLIGNLYSTDKLIIENMPARK